MHNIILAVFLVVLSGCSVMQGKVTNFHSSDFDLSRKEFSFAPVGDQVSSLEYGMYAEIVEEELIKIGWQKVDFEKASSFVALNFGINSSGDGFTRFITVLIVDRAKSSKEKLHILYEGRCVSEGESSHLNLVIPHMIRAIFKDFPGINGDTRGFTVAI